MYVFPSTYKSCRSDGVGLVKPRDNSSGGLSFEQVGLTLKGSAKYIDAEFAEREAQLLHCSLVSCRLSVPLSFGITCLLGCVWLLPVFLHLLWGQRQWVLQNVEPKKLATDLQSKRNGRLLNWFQPRRTFRIFPVILMSQWGKQMYFRLPPLKLGNVVWYYLVFCVKMVRKVKWTFP